MVIPFLHVRSCSGRWTWMRSASRSGSLISLGVRAAGSKVGQNMAWRHCCCLCWALSPVLLPFVLRFCSFTLSASSWAGGLEESGVERGVPGEQGRVVGHLQLARFICKPLQLQAICNCNPVGMLVGGPVVIPFLHVRSCSGRWTWMRPASRSGSLISLGVRAAGSKVLGSNVGQNMAWLHCCCVCWVLSLESNRSLSDRV